MKKILVIEDDSEMRRNIVLVLQLEQYQPIAAENGRVGVELAKREKPDLILCDVMMPELDGYGVLKALREDTNTTLIPFVFLTAKGEKDADRDRVHWVFSSIDDRRTALRAFSSIYDHRRMVYQIRRPWPRNWLRPLQSFKLKS
jgi:CheY-like chemotaxis protein